MEFFIYGFVGGFASYFLCVLLRKQIVHVVEAKLREKNGY